MGSEMCIRDSFKLTFSDEDYRLTSLTFNHFKFLVVDGVDHFLIGLLEKHDIDLFFLNCIQGLLDLSLLSQKCFSKELSHKKFVRFGVLQRDFFDVWVFINMDQNRLVAHKVESLTSFNLVFRALEPSYFSDV